MDKIKILVGEPQIHKNPEPNSPEGMQFNYGVEHAKKAYESCIKEVTVDELFVLMTHWVGAGKEQPFEQYLMEQIGEK